jgi:Flp pilus assembly protein TadD
LKQALERAGKVPPATVLAARREYTLEAGSPAQREAAIKRVVDDLRKAMAEAPPDAETRFGMNLNFTGRTSAAPRADSKASSVSYNPHDVGNDLGLWVMGTGWMSLVEEVLTPKGEPVSHPDSAPWWVLEGIGFSIMGDSERAQGAFARALELDPNDELAHLGRGVALVIAGDEAGAAKAYARALEINPKNRAAADGLKWLQRGSALKGGKRAS